MSPSDLTHRIQEILHGFRGSRPLKELFWTELNYDRANEALSRRNWPQGASDALAQDPLLLATAGRDDEFHVIYCQLAAPVLRVSDERAVVGQLLREHPYALFVFSNRTQDQWHFLNVKIATPLDTDENRDSGRRRLFRRITVAPGELLRTGAERIALLDADAIRDGDQPSALAIQQRHDEAFDVEAVTKAFYRQYREIFEEVERLITGFGTDSERKRLFVQRLFNRLMFLAFVQKKGWLKFGDSTDYLEELWKDYLREKSAAPEEEHNFYKDRLQLLFFAALNGELDVAGINRGGFLRDVIGEVPYLNGGLFEKDELDETSGIDVPDRALDLILHELFGRFNFTVSEATPLDMEVAVDPEMLGKVFEELVTGRHESGSYYTPKPIVSFMCREALKGYLQTAVPQEKPEAVARFVDEHDASGLRDGEAVLQALKEVKACDPACGSGAYLLGLLHELLDLRAALFATRKLDTASIYERKLEIIQNNVYGVDLDEFAVNIARLRLWLSLVVDFEREDPSDRIPPLPNLDFKIEQGDSLTAPMERQYHLSDKVVHDFEKAKADYMCSHHGEKRIAREKVAKLRQDIVGWAHAGGKVEGFDWVVEFAEVFADKPAPTTIGGELNLGQELAANCSGGFDIVLANPPYVRADAQFQHIQNESKRQAAISQWKNFRANLVKSGSYETLYEKWDLYIPFLERAFQILRSYGQMVFIIPDAYNGAKYTRKSHEHFLGNSTIARVDFCTDIPLFSAGVSNTILLFTKKEPSPRHVPTRVRHWGESADDFAKNSEILPTLQQITGGRDIFRPVASTLNSDFSQLPTLSDICYVSVGMVIHSHEQKAHGQFRAEELISEIRDATHPKPYIEGKDITRWCVSRVRFLEWGTQRAPALFRRKTFMELYTVPEKLISLDIASNKLRVAYDNQQLFHNHSAWSFVPWHYLSGVRNRSLRKSAQYTNEMTVQQRRDSEVTREQLEVRSRQYDTKYLLAVMNSDFAQRFIAATRRSKMHVYPEDWKKLPIVSASPTEQQQISAMVDEILSLCGARDGNSLRRIKELEADIEDRVATLYGLKTAPAHAEPTK